MTVRHRFTTLDFASKENPNFMTIQTLTILPAPYEDQKRNEFPRRKRPKRENGSSLNQWLRMNSNWTSSSLSKLIPQELPFLSSKLIPSPTKPSTWDPLLFSTTTSAQSRLARTQTEAARTKLNFLRNPLYPNQHRPRNESSSLSVLSEISSASEKRYDRDRKTIQFIRSTLNKHKTDEQLVETKKTSRNDPNSNSHRRINDLWFPSISQWDETASTSSVNFRRRRFSVVLPTVPEQQNNETNLFND